MRVILHPVSNSFMDPQPGTGPYVGRRPTTPL